MCARVPACIRVLGAPRPYKAQAGREGKSLAPGDRQKTVFAECLCCTYIEANGEGRVVRRQEQKLCVRVFFQD